MKYTALLGLFCLGLTATGPAFAAQEYSLIIKDHKFSPETLEIPAGEKVKITIDNQDPTPEEFESYELHREKVIPGGTKAVVFIGPLEPGEYPFFGEFNMNSAKGRVVAK